jgi:4-hydroxyacetophenone monooxygenase
VHLSRPVDPLPNDDDEILRALDDAVLPPLLCALAYISGDLSLLSDDVRIDALQLLDPTGGLRPDQIEAGRQLAFEALTRFRDSGARQAPPPTLDELKEMIDYTSGGMSMDEYIPMLNEELAVAGEDLRAPEWERSELAPGTDLTVAVIGAGMSGLAASYRLKQAGVDHVIIEKNDDVGGTWLQNTYPGCRVDVPNHLYSYSFAQTDDWPHHFSTQGTLLGYFQRCADEFGIRERIRFNTEVTSVVFNDGTATWTVQLDTPDGPDTLEVNAVISAVGQLNRPLMPDIEGMDRFCGPSFHSAEWPVGFDVAGKRVAVIGTGASAIQIIPAIAPAADHVSVFQRTPPWLVPTPDYHAEVPEGLRWLFRHVPTYSQWYRYWLFWRMADGLLPTTEVDPGWPEDLESVSAPNEFLRQTLLQYYEDQFGADPDLLAKVLPHYPPSAKRALRDNGIWASTLMRDDVDLIGEPIQCVTATGVRTTDGTDHDVDVIVYGTGFTASRFLTPMKVVGRDGVDLHQWWDGDARAYKGITMPGFPNLFLLYGPNTNIVINGSIIFFSECEVHYVMACLRHVLSSGKRAIDCRPEVHDAYNERIDEANRLRAWGASDVNSWYKSASGRVAQNWPFTLLEYWQQTTDVDPADYELI